ncbi:uncharacterized protein LOC133737594 [Rosa rugosa]|uniref:uncharacterized protein LOC133737594 n=1 Tax=Rosa rugosa TaxID=74645 RepID=UPI002B40BFC5|nr:uncharacterized protein LOC133737594 [Rosa rugosa]
MANTSMNSISFKALVDKRSNKVIFIETDNDFVDVLFSFLTIPMGTIIRLARKHSLPVETGCMNNLYASVENIDARIFQTGACKDMLLCPRSGAELHCKNLKLKINNGEPTQYFLCSEDCTYRYNLFSHYKDVLCECGEPMDNKIPLSVGKLKKSSSADGGVFCKGLTRFIITDDLEVMPPSSSVICSLFTKLKVMDASTTEELAFNVGVGEVLEMLVCSLVSKMPLSETLLKLKSQPNLSNEYPNQGICIEPQTVGGCMNEEDTISVKLIICKSQKIVCYAEAGEDFVNLLFSFLTVPLGFIIKQIQDRSSSLKGSIEQLYKTVQDLDDEFFKSNYQKEILLNPKLYPGFCYENRLLGIEYVKTLDGTLNEIR